MNIQKQRMATPMLAEGRANLWTGLIGGLIIFASAQVVAQVAPPRGVDPTQNQLVAYCEIEWNRSTGNGTSDVTGSRFLVAALEASSESLRSGTWMNEYRRREMEEMPGGQAFADCLSRGVLAGRNGTFRTPSMIVKTPIDDDARGRQDPAPKRKYQ